MVLNKNPIPLCPLNTSTWAQTWRTWRKPSWSSRGYPKSSKLNIQYLYIYYVRVSRYEWKLGTPTLRCLRHLKTTTRLRLCGPQVLIFDPFPYDTPAMNPRFTTHLGHYRDRPYGWCVDTVDTVDTVPPKTNAKSRYTPKMESETKTTGEEAIQ